MSQEEYLWMQDMAMVSINMLPDGYWIKMLTSRKVPAQAQLIAYIMLLFAM